MIDMTDTELFQTQRLIYLANNGVKNTKQSYPNYTTYCGFNAVNGYHCVPDNLDHCCVCKEKV